MENYFKVNYDTQTVYLFYQGKEVEFDLAEGDVGDYWGSFVTKDGIEKDINFYQESPKEVPSLSVYDLDEDGYIDTSYEEPIEFKLVEGNYNNYFKF